MGCCLSKNGNENDPKTVPKTREKNPVKLGTPIKLEQPRKQILEIDTNPSEGTEKDEVLVKKKKEVFLIQHRKSNGNAKKCGVDSEGSGCSNSSDPIREPEEIGRNLMAAAASGQVFRTSSCTKEEVDAILIQCGKTGGNGPLAYGKRYSGSKRSFDFDKEELVEVNDDGDERLRRRRASRGSRRRASLSRSREREQTPQHQHQHQQRSGSRERSQSNGRRVSRSPARRSESPIVSHGGNVSGNGGGNVRPWKLVSVPATVSSLSGDGGNVKKGFVKRSVGSPRSQSPARGQSPGRGVSQGDGNGGQQGESLSRNGSRKAEHSPYRRTPLNEIDVNSLQFHPLSNKKRGVQKGKEVDEDVVVVKQKPVGSGFQQNKSSEANTIKAPTQGTHRRTNSRGAESYEVTKTNYCRVNEHQKPVEKMSDNKREQLDTSEYDAMVTPVIVSGTDTTLKLPQTLMRSRSGRRSRDLDINVEALLAPNPATNYNSLLLQDIQNFHQKKSSNSNSNAISCNNSVTSNIDSNTPPFNLPACVSKACSIVEAVADLNSTTVGSNLKTPREPNFSFHSKKGDQFDDPSVQSEVKVGDDLMEPSLHKYVTVRKRGGDMDGEESSGSNSFVSGGCQQNWVSSSSWEPNSAESSTDCWTSKSYSLEEVIPAGFQRHAISDLGCGALEESERKHGKAGAGTAHTRTVAGRGAISASKPGAASM